MKKQSFIASCVLALLGIVIAVGVVSFLGPCIHEDGGFGACHWAGQAMLGIGILLAAEGLLALVIKSGGVRSGLLFGAALTAVLGILVPGTLIDLCHMATMRCRALMQPAMMILCAVSALAAIVGGIAEYKESGSSAGTES